MKPILLVLFRRPCFSTRTTFHAFLLTLTTIASVELGASTSSLVAAETVTSATSGRPNILFIMADDHNQAAIGCYGSKTAKTPNLDRLAGAGVRFNQMFVTNALCGPSRAVLLTGKYSHLNGFQRNGDRFDGSQQTFPKLLRQTGYETALVGKWHLQTQPTGFDYYNVIPDQGRYYDCRLKETGAPWEDGKRGGVVRKGYLTDVITDVSIEWLEQRKSEKPFMLMVHHKAPHAPHDPAPRHKDLFKDQTIPEPSSLLDDYEGRVPGSMSKDLGQYRLLFCKYKERREEVAKAQKLGRTEGTRYMYQTYMKGYLRLVASLDENVGRLLDYLDRTGLSDNTVIIYTSDNGFFNGEHGFFNKMWMYEPSLRLPLIVRWPGKVKAETVNENTMMSMIDIAPTLLDIAGAPVPDDMQGRSFKPLLTTGQTPDDWRKSVYYHYNAQFGIPEIYGVRTERYKLIRYPALDRWELFDLQADPDEMHNLFGRPEHDATTAQLRAELDRLRKVYREE